MHTLQSIARKATLRGLQALADGQLTIVEGGESITFGRPSHACPVRATVTVHDLSFYRRLLFGGSMALGETFVEGLWSCDNLTALLRIGCHNRNIADGLGGGWAWVTKPLHQMVHWTRRNTPWASRRHIAAHYDLGNDFFQSFLDETMTYSCGLFKDANTPLLEASIAKNDLAARKLCLSPQDHLLEIGGGWGAFAIHAATRYGCRVTTTTISKRQYDYTIERVRGAGLEGQITVLCEDYRHLAGCYDKLASIEMIEAVGWRYLDTYFACCSRLLKPDGAMMLQAITIADQQYDTYKRTVDFIQRYIFPGGCLPSIAVICNSVARFTDLRVSDLEAITPHYIVTLGHWRDRLLCQKESLLQKGYSDTLLRLWEYYLSYCEAGFRERNTGVIQLVLAKPYCRSKEVGGVNEYAC